MKILLPQVGGLKNNLYKVSAEMLNFEDVDHINEAKGFSCFCSSIDSPMLKIKQFHITPLFVW
jgi:hypothetical protein